jgi:hypothetical protein
MDAEDAVRRLIYDYTIKLQHGVPHLGYIACELGSKLSNRSSRSNRKGWNDWNLWNDWNGEA